MAFLMAIGINILILLSFERNADGGINEKHSDIVKIFGYIVIVLASIIVGYFLAKTAPILIAKAWVGWKTDMFNLVALVRRVLMSIYYLLTDFYVVYYLMYAFCAALGLAVSPFFFFFHLFDTIVRFPVLQNVIKAVWGPKKSILFTYFLFIGIL
jgi:hypothetical protein